MVPVDGDAFFGLGLFAFQSREPGRSAVSRPDRGFNFRLSDMIRLTSWVKVSRSPMWPGCTATMKKPREAPENWEGG